MDVKLAAIGVHAGPRGSSSGGQECEAKAHIVDGCSASSALYSLLAVKQHVLVSAVDSHSRHPGEPDAFVTSALYDCVVRPRPRGF